MPAKEKQTLDESLEDVTLTIPTKDRSDFIERVLSYYQAKGFQGVISIGDSSEGRHLDRNLSLVSKFESTLRIEHRKYPRTLPGRVSALLSLEAQTAFSAYLNDDDLVVPESLKKGMRLLKADGQIAAVTGKSLYFKVNQGEATAFGKLGGLSEGKMSRANEEGPFERIERCFSMIHRLEGGLTRAEIQNEIARQILKLNPPQDHIFNELLGVLVVSMRGKIIELENLFLFIQSHHQHHYIKTDMYRWFTDETWHSGYQLLRETFAEGMPRKNPQSSLEDFDKVLRDYFINLFAHCFGGNKNNPKSNLIENFRVFLKKKNRPFYDFLKRIRHGKILNPREFFLERSDSQTAAEIAFLRDILEKKIRDPQER